MVAVIKPLGDLITTLPVGSGHPGTTAGPSFELCCESDYLMPHREAAGLCSPSARADAVRVGGRAAGPDPDDPDDPAAL